MKLQEAEGRQKVNDKITSICKSVLRRMYIR